MSPVRHSGMPLPTASSGRATSSAPDRSSRPRRRRRRPLPGLIVAFMIVAAVVPWAASTASAAIDPQNCTGYPTKRIFLESQAWWYRTPGQNGTDHGRIHIGTCFPHAQKIAGIVRFDVRVIMHNNPGTLTHVNIGIVGDSYGIRSVALTPSWKCSQATCTRWFTTYVDTRKAPRDGRQEFRFRAQVKEPDGKEMIASTGWLAYLRNGKTIEHYRDAWSAEARGWYTGTGYANASIGAVPMTSISGTWSPQVRMTAGSGGIRVTAHRALLDADFHAGKPGTSIRSGAGSFNGTIRIDTTRLRNGNHKLVLIADANAPVGSVNRGLLVIPFTVRN
jgi:hypothetical protein